MKTWLVILLIAFALIAGYKFSGYQHQLSESNADKARLTTVLARSRATETSELKVIKPAAKLATGNTTTGNTAADKSKDSQLAQSQAREAMQAGKSDSSSKAPAAFYAETEGSLATFFALPPNNELFVLNSVTCRSGLCEVVGEYDGSETELFLVIKALEQEPWWQFGSPIVSTQLAQRGLKLNVSFAAQHQPNANLKYKENMQAELKQKVASAG